MCVLVLGAMTTVIGTLLPWTSYGFSRATTATFNVFSQPPATGYGYAVAGGALVLLAAATIVVAFSRLVGVSCARGPVWACLASCAAQAAILASRWWLLAGQARDGNNHPFSAVLDLAVGPWVCAVGILLATGAVVSVLRQARDTAPTGLASGSTSGATAPIDSFAAASGVLLVGGFLGIVGTLLPWSGSSLYEPASTAFSQPAATGYTYSLWGYVLVGAGILIAAVGLEHLTTGRASTPSLVMTTVLGLLSTGLVIDRVRQLFLQMRDPALSSLYQGSAPIRYGVWVCGAGFALSTAASIWLLRHRMAARRRVDGSWLAPVLRYPRVARRTLVAVLLAALGAFAGEFATWGSMGEAQVVYLNGGAVYRSELLSYNGFEQSSNSAHSYALGAYFLAAVLVLIAAVAVTALVRSRLERALAPWLLGLSVVAAAFLAERVFYLWNLADPSYFVAPESFNPWIAITTAATLVCAVSAGLHYGSTRARRGATPFASRLASRQLEPSPT